MSSSAVNRWVSTPRLMANSSEAGTVTANATGESETRSPTAVPIAPSAVTLTTRPGPTPIGPTSIF
jgi:hypothetical protein